MKKVVTTLLDDIDNDVTADETVQFMIDGERYEIDLSDKNAHKLRDQLEPWKNAARRTAGRRYRNARTSQDRSQDRSLNRTVRRWAQEHGHRVSSRGRLPAEVMHAYEAANGQ